MKLVVPIIIRMFVILAACSMPVFGTADRIYDSFGAIDCEGEMAHLDSLTIELQNTPDSRAYIFIYGGRRGTYRDEVRVRAARMKRYLLETRGVNPERLVIINGGYRESLGVEIWIVPNDKEAPTADPTVDAKTVRFKKGRMARYREPGCFPGKYLNEKQHRETCQ